MMQTGSNAVGRGDHQRIIPTARLLAYFRSFSDIPRAKEVSEALRGEEVAKQIYQEDFVIGTRMAGPFMEARYKCFNPFIESHRNVLELAVGASVERGLSISDSAEKIYIGTDLPEMIKETKALFAKIADKNRTNHHLEAANVLSYEQLNVPIERLGINGEILIINEGLWMYLMHEEQVVFAENIRRILERYGGKWVTPDITDLEASDEFISSLGPDMSVAQRRIMQRFATVTGREFDTNYFVNPQDAIRFFQNAGFKVKQYPMVCNLASVTSIEKLWGKRERSFYEPALRTQLVWELSVQQQ